LQGFALKRLTELILAALETTYSTVVHPVMHGERLLQDRAPSIPHYLGQNARLPRLEDQRLSDMTPATPKHDQIGRWQRRQEKPIGTLTDRSAR
jgi:hypothetical protein